jgi:hypothetical protein
MRRSNTRGLWIMGLFFALHMPAMAVEASEYPEGLEFLAEINPPKYLTAIGYISTIDSSGKVLAELPIRFYWEAENEKFALDLRMPGGGAGLYVLGIADTVWAYNFIQQMNVTAFLHQYLASFINIPLSIENLLPLFNIFTHGFDVIDTFYQTESLISVTRKGVEYSFDAESKLMLSLKRGATSLSIQEFSENESGLWPKKAELNQAVFVPMPGVASTQFNITILSFKRQRRDNLFDVDLPTNMRRSFDIRQ